MKEMFKAGSQPTGQDFSDFIDSITNSLDDGFVKPSETNLPLRVESNGDSQNIFDFYDDDGIYCWRINQYPEDTSVGGQSVQRAGLNIEDSNGASRFFIKQDNGDIGLGTVNPTAKLHVVQAGSQTDALRVDDMDQDTTPFLVNGSGAVNIRVDPEDYDQNLSMQVSGPVRFVNTDGTNPSFEIYKGTDISTDGDGDTDKPEAAFSVRENGAVGIGTDAPDEGVLIKGGITLGSSDDDVIAVKGIIKSSSSSGNLTVQDTSVEISSDSEPVSLSIYSESDKCELNISSVSSPSELKISGSGTEYINAGIVLEADYAEANNRGLGMFMYDKKGQNEWFVGRPYSDSDSFTVCRKEGITDHDVTCCEPGNSLITFSDSGSLGIGKTPTAKLDVAGDIKADGNTEIKGSLTADGPLSVGGTVALERGLHIGGSSDPGDKNLIVDGNTEIAGALTVTGNFTVNGDVHAKDIEHVTGNVVLGNDDSDTVTVEGILKSGHSSGALEIQDDLNVSGSVVLGNDANDTVSVKGVLQTSGAAQIQDSLNVTGTMWSDGTQGDVPTSGAGTRFMWIPSKGALRAGSVAETEWDAGSIGANSLAVGSGVTASGDYAAAIGRGVTAPSYGSLVVGTFNDLGGGSSGAWLANDPLFVVGNGTSDSSRSNALTVLKNGNVGFGTPTPLTTVHVVGDLTTNCLRFPDGTTMNTAVVESSPPPPMVIEQGQVTVTFEDLPSSTAAYNQPSPTNPIQFTKSYTTPPKIILTLNNVLTKRSCSFGLRFFVHKLGGMKSISWMTDVTDFDFYIDVAPPHISTTSFSPTVLFKSIKNHSSGEYPPARVIQKMSTEDEEDCGITRDAWAGFDMQEWGEAWAGFGTDLFHHYMIDLTESITFTWTAIGT